MYAPVFVGSVIVTVLTPRIDASTIFCTIGRARMGRRSCERTNERVLAAAGENGWRERYAL